MLISFLLILKKYAKSIPNSLFYTLQTAINNTVPSWAKEKFNNKQFKPSNKTKIVKILGTCTCLSSVHFLHFCKTMDEFTFQSWSFQEVNLCWKIKCQLGLPMAFHGNFPYISHFCKPTFCGLLLYFFQGPQLCFNLLFRWGMQKCQSERDGG